MAQTGRTAHNLRMRTPSRLLLALCLTGGVVLGPAVAALAAPSSGTVTAEPGAEAWYRSTPSCALPTGCVDATGAPSPYPAQTLHVGVVGGPEETRTYLRLDLGALPSGTKPNGGTLLLPVAPEADGTRAPDTATIQACAVTGEVEDADGSFAPPPEVDCEQASVPAVFVPAEGENPAAFTVDLATLAAAWQDQGTPGALALLPAAETAPPANWHVAFSQRERTGDGVSPITAAVSFVSDAVDTSLSDAPVVEPPPFAAAPAFESAPSFDSGASFASPALTVEAPLVPQPAAQAAPAPATAPVQQQVVPVASVVPTDFRYPGVFLLPLLVAVALGWLGRALTRDLAATS